MVLKAKNKSYASTALVLHQCLYFKSSSSGRRDNRAGALLLPHGSCSLPSEFDRLYLSSIGSAGDGGVFNVRLDFGGSLGGSHFDGCRGG